MAEDADASREFTEAETRHYNPRQCPTCGRGTLQWAFVDTKSFSGPPAFRRGRPRCLNNRCARNGGPEGAQGDLTPS